MKNKISHPITTLKYALLPENSKILYEDIKDKIIEDYGIDRFRTIQRIVFNKMFNNGNTSDYLKIYTIKRKLP